MKNHLIDKSNPNLGGQKYCSPSRGAVLGLIAILAMAGWLSAQTLTDLGAASPSPAPSDISQLGTNGNQTGPDSLNYYTDNQTAHTDGEPGQTFTTGNNSAGYLLTSASFKTAGLVFFSGTSTVQPYYLHFYANSDGSAIPLQTNMSANVAFADGDWLQWSGLSVPLAPNSTYAWSFGKAGSTSGWEAMAVSSGNQNAGGEIGLFPPGGGLVTFGGSHVFDAVFDLGLATNGAMMCHLLANIGDTFLSCTSAQSELRIHAVKRRNGNTGVMFINTDPLIAIAAAVSITNGGAVASTGTRYQFSFTNFIGANDNPSYAVASNSVSGLGGQFTVVIPAYTLVDLLLSPAPSNTPPALAGISNRMANVGQTVAFTASATDTDQPPPTLSFSLLAGTTNATLNPNSGAFSWRPLVAQAGSRNVFTLKVADNGSPVLSATQNFTVTVNPLARPALSVLGWSSGRIGFQVSGDAGPDYVVQGSTNLTDWKTLLVTNSPTMPFLWTDTNAAVLPAQLYRVAVGPPLP